MGLKIKHTIADWRRALGVSKPTPPELQGLPRFHGYDPGEHSLGPFEPPPHRPGNPDCSHGGQWWRSSEHPDIPDGREMCSICGRERDEVPAEQRTDAPPPKASVFGYAGTPAEGPCTRPDCETMAWERCSATHERCGVCLTRTRPRPVDEIGKDC
jgi:hypothetical protein